MIHTWHNNRSLWRVPVALFVLLGLALVASEPATHAEEGWPHLPTDAEIAQARDRLVSEWTFTNPPCGSECDSNQAAYDYKLCLAQACLNEFRMGQEVRESAITEIEIVKAHDPKVADPAVAAYVFFPYTLKQTIEYSDHSTVEVVEYHLARLDYGQESYNSSTYQQWVPTSRGFEIDVVQDDPASRAQRDAVLESYFRTGWLVRGFPGEAAAAPIAIVSPTPDPRFPCPWPAFFYPGVSFDGYLTGEPSLRHSKEWLVANLAGGLQSYIDEGSEPSLGIQATDAYYVGKTYASTAMPTGGEATLQQMARDLARDKQRSDPAYRLTPGDLLYLSLKVNHGNVRDALLTCHAALYRDGAEVNKAFIEQEGVLEPLRNPAGYVDGQWSYKTPVGTSRTINPRQNVSHDEQGVWYHFFGMAAVEFTDQYGAASYYPAWTIVSWGGLHENYTDKVKKYGHPTSNMGGDLADLAVALEDNIRSNHGAAPDVPKYCMNYFAAAAGRELKRVMWSYFGDQPNPIKERFEHLGGGDILNPDTTVTYQSPLSLRIEGTNGEWFTFDQVTGEIDGNTASIYFEAFSEDDGGWGVVAVPFFEVASMDMTATGDGPVTLGLYDPATTGSSVYEFAVQTGDAVEVPDGGVAAALNGQPLVTSFETPGNLPTAPPEPTSDRDTGGELAGRTLGLLGGVCGGLLVIGLVGGAVALARSPRRRQRAGRAGPAVPARAPRRPAARTEPEPEGATAPACPHCGAAVVTRTRFCRACGRSLGTLTPNARPDYEAARGGWQLVVVEGAEAGRCFVLGAEAHLGRSPDNDVCLPDQESSRQHALLLCADDSCNVYDLDSRNGTWVNGVRISQPTRLQAGDTIQLGDTVLRLKWDGE